jgi:hypothetical protein
VLLLALLSFWVGLAELPVQDRDEARYAQASRQMAETGDWVDIRFQEEARHVKPVGVYWMQAAVLELTGRTGTNEVWVHRIPSYLAGAFAALALIWAGTPLVGPPRGGAGRRHAGHRLHAERGGTDGEDRRDAAADHHPCHGGTGAGLAGSGERMDRAGGVLDGHGGGAAGEGAGDPDAGDAGAAIWVSVKDRSLRG